VIGQTRSPQVQYAIDSPKDIVMQHSKLSIALTLGLLCTGCGQRAAVPTTPTLATTVAVAPSSTAQADPDAQCKSWGIQPGSPGYRKCVDGMTEAANAEAQASGPQSAEQMQAEMAKMRAETAQQGDDLRRQVDDDMKATASNPKCVTVTNGTNTSVSCPPSP
jgi:hypothetical protein